ncbi:MAG: hypothetical protein UY74_C0020G0011 [Candidatus Kaiserbacteria bacterium GW2011_GWC2_52_8b]|uniref:HYR domain-containing protein n=1 Tax=Candidatus Kaiserbacteria bacterium GW2011_GWC2_52_8b TaxID=1618676 RepID=A0A0G2AFG4_9BACT|nr:MAG: hypothetical protein UY74_C0020G0011 [Candidatus Kaiserbacteria bacterium GW2011_GWC2_52_8b]
MGRFALVAVLFVAALFMWMPRSASASIYSANNATSSNLTTGAASSTLAKAGDTVGFQLNLPSYGTSATNTPMISIFNMGTTTMTSTATSSVWLYSTTTTSAWPTEGNITFVMAWVGYYGEATTSATVIGSAGSSTIQHVVFDKTAPTVRITTVASSNTASTTEATTGDTVTMTIVASENLTAPSVTFTGHTGAVTATMATSTLTGWTAAYTVASGDTNGALAFTFTPSDAAGNATTTAQAVVTSSSGTIYIDTAAPTVSVTGTNPDTSGGSTASYTDAGATASDVRDGTVTVTTTGSVNRAAAATYTLTYTATDAAGNAGTNTRTVTVVADGGGTAAAGGGGGGGGGYGSGGVWEHTLSTNSSTPSTSSSGNSAIDALRVQIAALLAQIAALQGKATPNVNAYANANANASFKRDLETGATGDDVKALQAYLNTHGYAVSSSGAGSSGNETTKFGGLTRAALIKLQKAAGITPAAGYFGPKTRAYVAAHQ